MVYVKAFAVPWSVVTAGRPRLILLIIPFCFSAYSSHLEFVVVFLIKFFDTKNCWWGVICVTCHARWESAEFLLC